MTSVWFMWMTSVSTMGMTFIWMTCLAQLMEPNFGFGYDDLVGLFPLSSMVLFDREMGRGYSTQPHRRRRQSSRSCGGACRSDRGGAGSSCHRGDTRGGAGGCPGWAVPAGGASRCCGGG